MLRNRSIFRTAALLAVLISLFSAVAVAGAEEGPTSSSDPGIPYWTAQYFNNTALSGVPVLEREEKEIDYAWVYGSPWLGLVQTDNFSARWTNTIPSVPAGTYRFVMTVDDGGRLWVNNQLVADAWGTSPEREVSALVQHPGGPMALKMEIVEYGLAATAKLYWYRLAADDPGAISPSPVTAGSIVKDSSDTVGILMDGPESDFFTAASGGYGGSSFLWSKNTPALNSRYNWVRWFPFVPSGPAAGRYEVYVNIPAEHSTATLVRYWVRHSGGYTKVHVSQAAHAGELVSLGIYTFKGRSWEFVSASDVSFEPEGTTEVAFDAVVLVPR